MRLKAKVQKNTVNHKVFSRCEDSFCECFVYIDVVRSFPFSDSDLAQYEKNIHTGGHLSFRADL